MVSLSIVVIIILTHKREDVPPARSVTTTPRSVLALRFSIPCLLTLKICFNFKHTPLFLTSVVCNLCMRQSHKDVRDEVDILLSLSRETAGMMKGKRDSVPHPAASQSAVKPVRVSTWVFFIFLISITSVDFHSLY